MILRKMLFMRLMCLWLVFDGCYCRTIPPKHYMYANPGPADVTYTEENGGVPIEDLETHSSNCFTDATTGQLVHAHKELHKREESADSDADAGAEVAVAPRGCGSCCSSGNGPLNNCECAKSVCCDPTGANSPGCQMKTTQLAQEAACAAKAAADAQAAAGAQASCQVKAQLAEKACQASNSAQAALAGKQAMVDFLTNELCDTKALLNDEGNELTDSDSNEQLMKQAVCASQQLARNMAITAQQAEKLSCILSQIDMGELGTEDEESGLLAGTNRKIEQLTCMADNARKDLECTCQAAKLAAQSAQQSQQNMRCRRTETTPRTLS